MSVAGAIRAGAAYVEVFLEQNALTRSCAAVSQRLRGWSASLSALGSRTYGGALPEPLAAIARFAGSPAGMFTGMLTAAKMAAAGGAEMSALATKAGTTVEAISALGYAARRSEVPVESLAGGLGKMARTIADAAQGGKAGAEALQMVGLSAADVVNLRPEEQFSLMADRIAAIQSPTMRTAAAMKVFGRGGAELMPLLMQGGAGIDAFTQRARDLGLVLSSDAAAQGRQFNQTLGDMSDVIKSGVKAIGGALVPVLNGATNILVRGLVAVRNWVKEHRALTVAVFGGVAAFVGAGVTVMVLGKALAVTGAIAGAIKVGIGLLGAVVSGAAAVVSAAWSAATAVMSGFWAVATAPLALLGIGLAIAAGAALYFSGALGELGSAAKSAFSTLFDDASSTIRGIADAIAAGDLGMAWKVVTATMNLEWMRLTTGLREAWASFRMALDAGIAGIQAIWGTFTAGLHSTWIALITALRSAWIEFQRLVAIASIDANAKELGPQATAMAKVAVNALFDAQSQANAGEGASKLLDAQTAWAADMARIQGELAGKLVGRGRDIIDAEQELNDAIAERKNLLQQAADAADAARAKVPDNRFAGVDLSAGGTNVGVVGTFNAAAIAGMGGSALVPKMLTALEELVRTDQNLLKEVRAGAGLGVC